MSECDRVWQCVGAGQALSPALAAHVASCEDCRRLAATEAWMTRRAHRKVALGSALRAAIAADPGPVVLRSAFRRALPSLLVVLGAVATTALLAPVRTDAGGILACVALGLMAIAGIGVVFHRGADGLGPPLGVRYAWVVAALMLFGAVAVNAPERASIADTQTQHVHVHRQGARISALMSQDWPGASSRGSDERRSPLGAGGCASYGLVLTLLVSTVLLTGARRTVPVSPEATGVCVGLTAGLVAATALGMHTAGGSAHMMLAHGLPVALGMAVGTTVGRRVLAP